jgi:hypothetical protein
MVVWSGESGCGGGCALDAIATAPVDVALLRHVSQALCHLINKYGKVELPMVNQKTRVT